MLRRSCLTLLTCLATFPAAALASADAADTWRLLQQGGHVLLLRHAATAPGIGDPPGFKLSACATQRNLSDSGRRDARAIGAAFRRHAIVLDEVLSSHWCRCLDTATLAFGRVKPAGMLDSMFNDDDAARERKLAAVRAHLAGWNKNGNLMLVTHDINIRALTGQYAAVGDMLVAMPLPDGRLRVLGTLPVPAGAAHHGSSAPL